MSDETIDLLTDENEKLRRANRLWKIIAMGALLIGVAFTSVLGGLVTIGWMTLASRGRAQQARTQAQAQAAVVRAQAAQAAQLSDRAEQERLAAERAADAKASNDSPDPE